jgi:hypothetical protein
MVDRRPPAPPADPRFALRIGELVIDGFAASEARAIGAALEHELARILADGAPPFAGRRSGSARDRIAVDRLDAGTVSRPPGMSPQAVGRAAADAIVGRLRGLASGPTPSPATACKGRA